MEKIKITDILSLIFAGLAAISILWYVFGNSPALEQGLLFALLSITPTRRSCPIHGLKPVVFTVLA